MPGTCLGSQAETGQCVRISPCALSLCPLEPLSGQKDNVNVAIRESVLHGGQLLWGSLTLFQASKHQLRLEVHPAHLDLGGDGAPP